MPKWSWACRSTVAVDPSSSTLENVVTAVCTSWRLRLERTRTYRRGGPAPAPAPALTFRTGGGEGGGGAPPSQAEDIQRRAAGRDGGPAMGAKAEARQQAGGASGPNGAASSAAAARALALAQEIRGEEDAAADLLPSSAAWDKEPSKGVPRAGRWLGWYGQSRRVAMAPGGLSQKHKQININNTRVHFFFDDE